MVDSDSDTVIKGFHCHQNFLPFWFIPNDFLKRKILNLRWKLIRFKMPFMCMYFPHKNIFVRGLFLEFIAILGSNSIFENFQK